MPWFRPKRSRSRRSQKRPSRVPARDRIPTKAEKANNESVAAIHFAAGRHGSVNGRDLAGGGRRLQAVACFGAAPSRLSDDSGDDVLSWRRARRDGLIGDRSPGTAIWTGAGAVANDVQQLRRLLGDHIAIRAGAEYRRGGTADPGGHQRGLDVSAQGSSQSAELYENQPGRRAHSDAGISLRLASFVEGRRPGRYALSAEDFAAFRRGHGQHQRGTAARHRSSG